MRKKYLVYLLICLGMIVLAMKSFPAASSNNAAFFIASWLLFALLAFAGNLAALLYSRKEEVKTKRKQGNQRKLSNRVHKGNYE